MAMKPGQSVVSKASKLQRHGNVALAEESSNRLLAIINTAPIGGKKERTYVKTTKSAAWKQSAAFGRVPRSRTARRETWRSYSTKGTHASTSSRGNNLHPSSTGT